MESLIPLLRVIIKSFPAGMLDVPVGLAVIFKDTYELSLFFYFPNLLGLSNNSSGFGMSPIICGGPCTVTLGYH